MESSGIKKWGEVIWSKLKATGLMFYDAGVLWVEDDSSSLAAALAFYAVFSIVPLLIILSTLLGYIYGQEAAQQNIVNVLAQYFGDNIALLIREALHKMTKAQDEGMLASVISAGVMLYGAAKVFVQLQLAFNRIWKVRVRSKEGWAAIWMVVKDRILSIGMVFGLVFVLLISLVLSTVIQIISDHAVQTWWLASFIEQWQLVGLATNVTLHTVLFAMLFRFVPDVELSWRAVSFGALITAALFLAGQWALGMYLSKDAVASAYGAAGAMVSFLLWFYYSAQVVFFGAELTRVQTLSRNWKVRPSKHAEWLPGCEPESLVSVDEPLSRRVDGPAHNSVDHMA